MRIFISCFVSISIEALPFNLIRHRDKDPKPRFKLELFPVLVQHPYVPMLRNAGKSLLRCRFSVSRVCRSISGCSVAGQHKTEERPDRYVKGGYHPLDPGTTLNEKYLIKQKLGFGQFSTVWLARNQKPDRLGRCRH